LRGCRFVTTIEAGEGRAWDEARLKWLTGGDTISARFLYGNEFSFQPTHKFWVAANHRPKVSGTDEGFWRRIKEIPFTVTISDSEKDCDLPEKLRKELPGILAWAVAGCRAWQLYGLAPPAEVSAAIDAYRAGEDRLGAFIEEECITGAPTCRVRLSELYARYRAWAEAAGEQAITLRDFGAKLNDRGLTRRRGTRGYAIVQGIGFRASDGVRDPTRDPATPLHARAGERVTAGPSPTITPSLTAETLRSSAKVIQS
jgi:putative DNA primase/helicase